MEFASKTDFLEAFGIEPAEEDATMAYCRYLKHSSDKLLCLDFSYSAVAASFQVVLKAGDLEVFRVSSELVQSVRIRYENSRPVVHVVFDFHGLSSEAVLVLEPSIHCHWWTLRSE